ncbi:MAG: Ldh family oxidoreductase [Armatimonadota bacterium]
MPVVGPDELERIAEELLAAAGAPADEARIVAGSLVAANLAGHDSHGILRLPQYLAAMEAGGVTPGAPMEVVRETPAAAVLDANWGFGQVAAKRAAEMAIAKAEEGSLAAVAVRRSNHVGRLGEYVELIAARAMVGLMFVNGHGGAHNTVPWGGADRRLCTNPLACALPTSGDPIVLDISTSAVAEGKVRTYRIRGEPVPDDWIVDSEGRPSNDPGVLYASPPGGLLPMGGNVGYKGFGLSLMVDLLAGALSGAGCSGPEPERGGNAFLIMALDSGAFAGRERFATEADALLAWVKSSRLAPGAEEILAPGEIERRERRRRREGIPVADETWQQLLDAAARAGIEVT